ncbi:Gfo/Idh/MocA family protein [Paenibacillus sp. sgz500958]|uniref:Gfo/Idh/MocA family protein n=1 Tax=Paenibacillus sp. sgz500958 TaxID=3242475 RepID=UPI0036D33F0C
MSIGIGVISFWHVHAWDYVKEAQAHEDTYIAAVWDEDPVRGQEAADSLKVPYFSSLDEMLAKDDVEAVIVVAPTTLHKEVMVAAALAGKHIFTEKVIAPTMSEVDEIMTEVNRTPLKLTVSLPRLNDGYTLSIEELLRQEVLGEITYVRVRLSHNGAIAGWLPDHFYNLSECSGGALIDLGCHPMYLTRLFLGQEITGVNANFGYITGKEVEDNAVATLFTNSGAIGVVEAGFVNSHSPFTIEVHGTEGTLLYGTPDEKLLLKSNKVASTSNGWTEMELSANREGAFHQWVGHIQKNTNADQNIQTAIELTRLMEAANLSAREGRTVTVANANS